VVRSGGGVNSALVTVHAELSENGDIVNPEVCGKVRMSRAQ